MQQLSLHHRKCPYCGSLDFVKNGCFYKKISKTYIPRFKCHSCLKGFSTRTLSPTFRQKRLDLNQAILDQQCSGVSLRQIARNLKCSYMTVYRKFQWMGPLAEEFNQRQKLQASVLIFDETLSIEHTKLKPLTIALAVNEDYQILGAQVGSIPAFGKIADISRKKYGPRANQSNEKVTKLLTQVKRQLVNLPSEIRSDKKSDYVAIAANVFSSIPYKQYSSRGNKEKKREQKYLKAEKLIHDPLFPLNQRCAKIRDHIKRMARRNWCTTKNPQHLQWALQLYITKNNGYDLFSPKNFPVTA